MTPSGIIALALDNSFTTTEQFPTPKDINAFNLSRRDVAQKITTFVNERFFWDIFITDGVAQPNNGEYLIPTATSSAEGLLKVEEVYVKDSPDAESFTKCREVDPKGLSNDWNWYLDNQAWEDPIYWVADKSVFIAPSFKTENLPTVPAGNGQVKLTGIKNMVDLTTSNTEADIAIPVEYHPLIAKGMEKYIFNFRGKRQDAILSDQQYDKEWRSMVQELTNRTDGQMIATLPNNSNLGYAE
jgi:hypothetical protein